MSQIENLVKKGPQNIICPDCGATFSIREKCCPFCGHVNEIGDELAYQQKLEDIREDLEDLEDIPEEMLKEEAVSGAKKVAKITLIMGCILLFLAAGFFTYFKTVAKLSSKKVGKEIVQQREFFASLDELYDNGDYEAIYNIYNDALINPDKGINIYSWKHNQFIMIYMYYSELIRNIDLVIELYDMKNVDDALFKEDAAYVFYDAAVLLLSDWDKEDYNNSLTGKDKACIEEYKAYAADVLDKHFHIGTDDLEELRDVLYNDNSFENIPGFDNCLEYGRTLTWYK